MSTGRESSIISFLNEIMRQRYRLPSQLARDLGVSHVTVSRWLAGKDIPGVHSCQKLSEYSGISLERVLSIAGYLPKKAGDVSTARLEFRKYSRSKYPADPDDGLIVLIEDLITLIEDLIEHRRQRRHGKQDS